MRVVLLVAQKLVPWRVVVTTWAGGKSVISLGFHDWEGCGLTGCYIGVYLVVVGF